MCAEVFLNQMRIRRCRSIILRLVGEKAFDIFAELSAEIFVVFFMRFGNKTIHHFIVENIYRR